MLRRHIRPVLPSTRMQKVPLVAVALVGCAVVVAAAADGAISPDQRLARKIVIAKHDVLSYWMRIYDTDPLANCLGYRYARVANQATSAFGSPRSGVYSFASVFRTKKQANRFYAVQLRSFPRCLRGFVRRWRPTYVSLPQALELGRYGDRSEAGRLRFVAPDSRRAYDWAVVRFKRAVVTDVFLIAFFDTQWREITSLPTAHRRASIWLERRILRRQLARAKG